MRLAVVTPCVTSVLGYRAAFVVARALAHEHEVLVVADAVSAPLVPQIQAIIAPARLEALRTPTLPPMRMSGLLWLQLIRGRDRAISHRLRTLHEQHPFDAVLVFSDEGHWIGEYIRRWPVGNPPVTLLEVLELLDHPFLLRYERSYPVVRGLSATLYPLLHRIEDRRLRSFDGLVTISRWTTTLLGYLYGLRAIAEVVAYDDERFAEGPAEPASEGYLAVPTAALDEQTTRWVEQLSADGVPMRLYGPRPAGRVPSAGFLPEQAMADLLRHARATVFLFDYEAFGLIPVESLAVGTPVITLPKGGPYEELRTNPNVHFAATYSELLETCRRLAGSPKGPGTEQACRSSVERFRPAVAATKVLAAIETARRARRGRD